MKKPIGLICLFLSLALSLWTFSVTAADNTPALGWAQEDTVTAGGTVTLTLTLSQSELAGGFLQLEFDHSLLTLEQIALSPAAEDLNLSWADVDGHVNLLLDGVRNVRVDGALLILTFCTSEEIQPGSYEIICTVPNTASFYTLDADGTALPLDVSSCTALLTVTDPPLPPASVRYLACQETAARDDQFSVRLCAAAEYDLSGLYGFSVLVTDADGTRELTLGGSALLREIDGGGQTYSAEQMEIFALYTSTLSLSARGEVTMSVTPYNTNGDVTLYGGTYTIVYRDGIYVSSQG